MPIAHTCPCCGCELSRIAAPLDPVYRLPIVVCPGCREPTVRRSDGARAVPRAVRLRVQAASRLVRSLALLVVSSAGLVVLCFALQSTLDEYRVTLTRVVLDLFSADQGRRSVRWREGFGLLALVPWLGFAVGAGAYFVAAAPGRRRWRIVALWLIVAAGTVLLAASVVVSSEVISSVRSDLPVRFIPSGLTWWIENVHEVFIGAAIVAPLGVPIGLIVRLRAAGRAGRRYRRLRRRIMARRTRP